MNKKLFAAALMCVCFFMSKKPSRADDWKSLIKGDTLDGWQMVDGDPGSWTVKDGVLSTSGKGGGWILTDREYSNFELELEFKVSKEGNSGVYLRVRKGANPDEKAMEIQILDDTASRYANLKPYQYAGSLYWVVGAKPRVSKPAGEWQKMHIVLDGTKLKVTFNGTQVVDTDLKDHKDLYAAHPGLERTSGLLGLQNETPPVEFRNIRVRELP